MKTGLSLFEESFCQLMALGKTGREAYSEAFGRTPKRPSSFDRRISYLASRPEIAARIDEVRQENRRKNAAMWEQRGEEIANGIFAAVARAIGRSDEDGKPMILDRDTLKGVEVLAKLKGLNAPDEHTLRNGGVTEDYNAPKALQEMTEEQLSSLIKESSTEKSDD